MKNKKLSCQNVQKICSIKLYLQIRRNYKLKSLLFIFFNKTLMLTKQMSNKYF